MPSCIDRRQVGALFDVERGCAVLPTDGLKLVAVRDPSDVDTSARPALESLIAFLTEYIEGKSQEGTETSNGWLSAVPLCLRSNLENAVEYLCMLVAIDFRHWAEESEDEAHVGDVVNQKNFYAIEQSDAGTSRLVRGSQAMVLLLREAVDVSGVHWYDTDYLLADNTSDAVRRSFLGVASDGVTPMFMPATDNRIQILLELAQAKRSATEIQSRGNKFLTFLSMMEASEYRLYSSLVAERQESIVSACPGFFDRLLALHSRYDDSAILDGQLTVYFLKLAQLTAIAVHTAFPESISFKDYDQMSVCSDYQLPKALRSCGLLVYSQHLQQLVDERRLIAPGSREEVEIRLGSTLAAERLKQHMNASVLPRRTSASAAICDVGALDYALWYVGRSDSSTPHHLCRTVMY